MALTMPENRLIAMETDTNKVGAALVPRRRLKFTYGVQSRCISRTASDWNDSSFIPHPSSLFVYDGWNLLAEVGTTGSVVRAYVWGLDVSGTEHGGTGVTSPQTTFVHSCRGGCAHSISDCLTL